MKKPTRPALRYHGGKWKLAPWIISKFPPHKVYVEPYGGAASVLLQKPRSHSEIYNDLDQDIVNLFRVLRNAEQAEKLIEQLRLTPFSRVEFLQAYQTCEQPIEKARRTVVRSFMGFGSVGATGKKTGFRGNAQRSGTTPAHDWNSYPDALEKIVERLKGVVIENRPAEALIKHADSKDTLFYLDPPYPHSTRYDRAPTETYRHEMTENDHRQLANTLHQIKGKAIISGYQCKLYDDQLYSNWQRITQKTNADGARARTEALWISPNAIQQQSLFSIGGL